MIEEMDYHAKQNSSYSGFRDSNGNTYEISKNMTKDSQGNIIGVGEAWDSFKGRMHGAKDNVTSSDTYRQAMANKKMDNKK